MPVNWDYTEVAVVPAELASAISDEWEATLKAEVDRIYSSLTTKIANETDFQNELADRSSDAYAEFLGTTGGRWDADIIEMKQKVKLRNKYTNWKAGIDEVFGGTTPTFPDIVTAKKGNLSELKRVIGAVGHKALVGWNPASASVLLARGDTRVSYAKSGMMTNPANLHGVFDATVGALVSPSLIAEMVYAIVMAVYANEGGLTAQRDDILTDANVVLDTLINVALNATHKGTGYDFTIVLEWSATPVGVTVTATDTHPA